MRPPRGTETRQGAAGICGGALGDVAELPGEMLFQERVKLRIKGVGVEMDQTGKVTEPATPTPTHKHTHVCVPVHRASESRWRRKGPPPGGIASEAMLREFSPSKWPGRLRGVFPTRTASGVERCGWSR